MIALFWLTGSLGFLAHLAYLNVYLGVAAWAAVAAVRPSPHRRRSAVRALLYLSGPALCVALLYVVDLHQLRIAGGPDYRLHDVLTRAFAFFVGGPSVGAGASMAAGVGAVAAIGALLWRWRQGGAERVFFLVAAVLAPAIVLLVARPEVLFVRYFLVSIALLTLLLACLLADLSRRGPLARAAVTGCAVCFVLGNGLQVWNLFETDRDGFYAAVRFMAAEDASDTIELGAGTEKLADMMLAFYGQRVPDGKRLHRFDRAAWQQGPATWLVMFRGVGSELEPPEMGEMYGARYRLTSRFPASPLSGLDWFLYREDPSAPAPKAAPDAPPDPLR
jgi:hypothetical protein